MEQNEPDMQALYTQLQQLQTALQGFQHGPSRGSAIGTQGSSGISGSQIGSSSLQGSSNASQINPPAIHPSLTQPTGAGTGSSTQLQLSSRPDALSSTAPALGPISRPYQSIRGNSSQGHPNASVLSTTVPASYQPFLGLQTLAPGLSTSHVNQARLASSAATLPRQPLLPRRGRRRGSAQHPPSLPRSAGIEQCLLEGSGTQAARITVKIYPPHSYDERHADLFLYHFLRDSFNATLETNDLLQRHDLPTSTTVQSLVEMVARAMQASQSAYAFRANTNSFHLAHEALPLHLLSLVNRGKPRPSDNQVRLRAMSLIPGLTIGNLMADKMRYAAPICIEGNRFVVHFVVASYPLQGIYNGRLHTCVGSRIYSIFPWDSSSGMRNDTQDTDGCSSEGESESDAETVPTQPASPVISTPTPRNLQGLSRSMHAPPPFLTSTPTAASGLGTSANRDVSPTPPHSNPLLDSLPISSRTRAQTALPTPPVSAPLSRTSSMVSSFLPSTIWSEASPWVPSPPRLGQSYNIDTLSRDVFKAATAGQNVPKLEIQGENVDDLASKFDRLLQLAADSNDFTEILSPARGFYIVDQAGTITSLGEGIEREVIALTFQKYKAAPDPWFQPRLDGMASLRTLLGTASAHWTSNTRKLDLKTLGALCAIMLISKQCPFPFDPLIFHFIVHGCNLHSLHLPLVREWHPEICQVVEKWISIGPNGDVTEFSPHFSTFHDMPTSALATRDQAMHSALAGSMLYHSIFGPASYLHPEWASFIAGFKLKCRNGFSFLEVPRSFQGGSEAFFGLLWTSHIRDPTNLESFVSVDAPSQPSATSHSLLDSDSDSVPSFSYRKLFRSFLSGTGIPCPTLFEAAKSAFHSLVDLSEVDSPTFRFRMFTWAVTGSPSLDPSNETIKVFFVEDGDEDYAPAVSAVARLALAKQGKFCFKTCFRTLVIPASYVRSLRQADYSLDSEPPNSFEEAYNHWCLVEILGMIGHHGTIL